MTTSKSNPIMSLTQTMIVFPDLLFLCLISFDDAMLMAGLANKNKID